MKQADTFKEFVLDQLRDLRGLRVRRMFSGYGFYCDDIFFGIIARARLYFKTDAKSRKAYIERATKAFRPTPRQELRSYYEVPVEILEDSDQLLRWAREAIRVATSTKGKKKVVKR